MSTPEPPLPPLSSLFPHMHHNPATLPASLDPFTITTSTGFLPLHHPVTYLLPAAFAPMLKLAAEFPIVKKDGTQGLLATYQLGSIIEAGGLPNLTSEIDNLVAENGKPDLAAVTAVFRDYAFIASAYLLEPCWERWNNDHDGGYGLGREMLPACIAGPLVKTADLYVKHVEEAVVADAYQAGHTALYELRRGVQSV